MSLSRKSQVNQAVRASIAAAAAGSLLHCMPTFAQEAEAELEEVIVTGTRITKRDAVAESPILTIDSETLDNSGFTAVDQFLNTLPQVTGNVSSQSNNPSSYGQAFIDLRGLDVTRNLVLIDGRRGQGSTGYGAVAPVGAVDVNTIPSALVERVEIISGGAAAVYGADAVAGVVNFILKNRFTGVEVDAQYGLTEVGDGVQRSADLTLGSDFLDGRGNAVFNLSYYKRDVMYKDTRAFSAQASSSTGSFPGGSFSAGSSGITQAEVNSIFGAGNCSVDAAFGFNPDGTLFCVGTPNSTQYQIYGFTGPQDWIATQFAPDYFSYNFEPDNILVLPIERWNFFTRSNFDVNDHFQPYVQAMFTNYNANSELAPTPGTVPNIPATNPFIPAQLRQLLNFRNSPTAAFSISKRFNQLGGRVAASDMNVWQGVVGSKGAIAGSWNYDVYAQYGRTVQNEIQSGNVRLPRVAELLSAPNGGTAICAGGLNLFGTAPISPACTAYISLEAKNVSIVVQEGAEGVITGNLFQLPAGPVQTALGASVRSIELDFRPDGGLQPGQVIGFNEQLPVAGKLTDKDLFVELSIPVFSGAMDLSLTPAFRVTDNNQFGSSEVWKITADWTIVDSLRARGGFQKAVRSPGIKELYSPQINSFPSVTDPCQGGSSFRTGANAAQVTALCAAQYAPAASASFNSGFSQGVGISGGNPNLMPEKADSWTAGLVFSSGSDNPWLADTVVSLDYFDIKVDDVIDTIPVQTIVNRCFNANNANPTFSISNVWCQQFGRDPNSNGRINNLLQIALNQASIGVEGVDLTVDYNTPNVGAAGKFGMVVALSYIDSWTRQTSATDPVQEYVRTVSTTTGSAKPQWKGTFTTRWALGPASAQVTGRYIDTMYHADKVTNPLAASTGPGKAWYFDAAGAFQMTEKVTLRLGVNNVFDKPPQLYVPNVQANTDPSTYDILGRRYFAGVNVRL